MTQSPGHRKWPHHKVEEKNLSERFQVTVTGEVVADSDDILEVDEDHHPPEYYIPLGDINIDKLRESSTTTACPFKGKASYFNLESNGQSADDIAWTYRDPYDEHRALANRVAFRSENPKVTISRIT